MITSDQIVAIGKFQKTHALQGELNAVLELDADFLDDSYPLIVQIEGIMVPFYPEAFRTKGATTVLIKLEGVDTEAEAREFVNHTIYARKRDVSEFAGVDEENIAFEDELVGYHIIDIHAGDIGEVTAIDNSTPNELLIVRRPDDSEVMIPITDEFVTDVDNDAKTITMLLPEGLVDLNG